ncbi:hypothetical protein P5673_015267 [Acropora cervicornis]|uniref:Uncharacterized protein n=1 Tax=Acropora cervicornis TaxID=6130 RepID=A0AAD9V5D4_ACRCE|nr:hypothetical protein P5673_015267 [Acropora cervicornis]
MEDYVNPAKDINSNDYWISVKRPKAMAALRRAFPQAEWDVLTTNADSQIDDEDKQRPARWLAKLSSHYLGEEPLIHPEDFQRRIHDALCGLQGVVNIADDIIVVGWGKTLSEATHDHDRTVIELMDRLLLHGLRLNPENIKFKTCTAPFMGHILTPKAASTRAIFM